MSTNKDYGAIVLNLVRKIYIIFAITLYLTFSVGVVLHQHYCNGNLEVVNLYKAQSCCDDADSEKSCCRNTASIIKVEDGYDVLTQSVNFLRHSDFVVAAFPLHLIDHLNTEGTTLANCAEILSLLRSSPPIYLTNRVFII